MKIFIKDIPVTIVSTDELLDKSQFDQIYNGANDDIEFKKLAQDVLITNANEQLIDKFLIHLKVNGHKQLDEITFTIGDYRNILKHIKSEYTIIKAAGGFVVKNGKVLMINRLKKWDLPKGKLDEGEKPKKGAVREVVEECNIAVNTGRKICHTWHTYKRNGDKILKKTIWYLMYCVDDSKMKPQLKENIEQLQWMEPHELKPALYNSYASIRYVFSQYWRSY
jgi:ADP-ribose pyrophosphatase YjhB (NUDIX family)